MARVAARDTRELRWLRIEDTRLIAPFNERAFSLSVMNRPLSLFQREAVEAVLGVGRFREGEPLANLYLVPRDNIPTLVHIDSLCFDAPYLRAFWEQAARRDHPCQAAFRADDRAYSVYAAPLTRNLRPDRLVDGTDIYRVPLWYFPHGMPEGWVESQAEPILVSSDYREVGYYSVPEYMSTELGDLVHLLPLRSMLSIESWVHIYYANVIFGIFAIGGRFEKRADEDWRFRLRIMMQAMLEQTQMLSCSQVVHLGRNVHIDPSVVIEGPTFIGDNVTIEAGVVITNCIIGSNTSIGQNCQLFLSVIGEGCFLPFRASLFMSVLMENSIVAQNTCLQMSVVGRNTFVGAGNTFTDFLLIPKELMALGPDGDLEPTGQVVLGGCVGHNCRIGSGLIIYPARMIESDVMLVASPERRVIMKNIAFEESDHHKMPKHIADRHPRLYPRDEETLEETW